MGTEAEFIQAPFIKNEKQDEIAIRHPALEH